MGSLSPAPSHFLDSATVKMEDLNSTPSRTSTSHPTPPGSGSEARDSRQSGQGWVKKRKSWGQVLPEPKTNLPPRKRAKTEDEKEQRRIERVKRNRLAAHNSRERKRQEVECLQAEKDKVDNELQNARDLISRMKEELEAAKARHPHDNINTFDDYESLLYLSPTSPATTYARDSSETVCPHQTSFLSPVSMDSMETPRGESCQPATPAYTESELDSTQYSAVSIEPPSTAFHAPADVNDSGFSALPDFHIEDSTLQDLFFVDQFIDDNATSNNDSLTEMPQTTDDFFNSSFSDFTSSSSFGICHS